MRHVLADRLDNRAEMLQVAGGWHSHLAMLTEWANGRTPPAFWTVFARTDGAYEKRIPA